MRGMKGEKRLRHTWNTPLQVTNPVVTQRVAITGRIIEVRVTTQGKALLSQELGSHDSDKEHRKRSKELFGLRVSERRVGLVPPCAIDKEPVNEHTFLG